MDNRILHALHRIDATMRNTPIGPSEAQLTALKAIRDILMAQTNLQENTPMSPSAARRPGVGNTPLPGVPTQNMPLAENTPPTEQWTTVHRTRQQRLPSPPQTEPIAARTRSSKPITDTNYFALLAETGDNEPQSYNDEQASNDTTSMAFPVLDPETGTTLEHKQLWRHPKYKHIWDTLYADELGRLCQGVGKDKKDPTKQRVEGTNTFRPIQYQNIPPTRRHDITYTKVVCEVQPQKEDPNRTRITIGGNRICYPGDTGTRTGSLELVKLQVNSVLSTPDAMFACYDISNFYLGTPLDRPEYVRIHISQIPNEFIEEYNLHQYVHDGWVYFEITKGVYGLKQAGKLANDLLTE
jgi:hypothetical protein